MPQNSLGSWVGKTMQPTFKPQQTAGMLPPRPTSSTPTTATVPPPGPVPPIGTGAPTTTGGPAAQSGVGIPWGAAPYSKALAGPGFLGALQGLGHVDHVRAVLNQTPDLTPERRSLIEAIMNQGGISSKRYIDTPGLEPWRRNAMISSGTLRMV